MHPITDDSPLYNCTAEQLEEADTEFLILMRAVEDTFSQTVHSRFSYRYDEVAWGKKFVPMFSGDVKEEASAIIDLDQLDVTVKAPLN